MTAERGCSGGTVGPVFGKRTTAPQSAISAFKLEKYSTRKRFETNFKTFAKRSVIIEIVFWSFQAE